MLNLFKFINIKFIKFKHMSIMVSKINFQGRSPPPLEEVSPPKQFSAEKLPNIIVCGTGVDDNIPKIIVCRPMMECDTQPFSESKSSIEVMTQIVIF